MNSGGSNTRLYVPNKWVILRHAGGEHTILGGWGGGYLHGASWRSSTAMLKAEELTYKVYGGKRIKYWRVHNASGSVYELAEGGYGTTSMTYFVLDELADEGVYALTESEMYEYMDSLTSQSSESQLQYELPLS